MYLKHTLTYTMNLLAKLTLICVSSIILFSCKYNQNELGLDEKPDGGLVNAIFTDTVGFNMSTVMLDTAGNTDILQNKDFIIGTYTDPVVGKINASFYTQFVPNTLLTSAFNANCVFDSIQFVYYYGGSFTGDISSSPFNINVFRLTDSIYSARKYLYNSPEIASENTPLGTFNGILNFKVRGADSVAFKLDNAFGADLFSKLTSFSAEAKSNLDFVKYFKGVKITSNSNNAIVGGVWGSSGTGLVIYYRDENGTPKKFRYSINSNRFTKYNFDRSSTSFSSLVNYRDSISSNSTNNVSILQGGSPLAIKISFNDIKNLQKATGHNIAVNKAILELKNTFVKDTLGQPVISNLKLIECDSEGKILLNSSDSKATVQKEKANIYGGSNTQSAVYNSTSNSYIFYISDYIQAQLFDKKTRYYLIVSDDTFGYGNKVVLGDNKNVNFASKLKLYYTVIK